MRPAVLVWRAYQLRAPAGVARYGERVSLPWNSAFAAGFDAIETAHPTAAEAVISMIEYENVHGLRTPDFYISTAISSAGHRREPELAAPAAIPEAVRRNNLTGSRILHELVSSPSSLLTADNVMVPTELGHVEGWDDLDYLGFYFAWMSGLSQAGTSWYFDQLRDSSYAQVFAPARDRALPNVERWPAYRAFTEIAIAKVDQARSDLSRVRSPGCRVLVQLVDVGESLGSRAEALYAELQGLDVIAPSFGPDVAPELAADIARLTELGAAVGVARQPAELVATVLRRP